MTDARDATPGRDAPDRDDDARDELPAATPASGGPGDTPDVAGLASDPAPDVEPAPALVPAPDANAAAQPWDAPGTDTIGADATDSDLTDDGAVDDDTARDESPVAVPEIFVPADDATPGDAATDDVAAPQDERGVAEGRSDDDAWNDAIARAAQEAARDPRAQTPLAALDAAGVTTTDDARRQGGPGAGAEGPDTTDRRTVEVDTADADLDGHDDEPSSARDSAGDGAPSGWAVLARAMAPRANRSQVVAGVLCALLGFALVVQVRQNDESALSGLRQSELVRILDETTERGDQLRREVAELRGERDDLASGSDRHAAAIDSLRRSAITQGILSGRLPAQGPGVRVMLIDPDGDLQPVTMLNMLEELRNAGAEAIQLNDQRVTASSSFTGTRGHVLLDGVELEAPYEWFAIGDPSTLSIALQIPGGAMATVRGTGATGTVEEQDEVEITALRRLPEPSYATPAPPEGG